MKSWKFLPFSFLQKRYMCTIKTSKRWGVKQVTRSNLGPAVEQLKEQIQNADFIAVSVQCTGSHGAPWRRILGFDSSETAYYKAKDSTERFQLLHFAVCPFKWSEDSKIIAFPYNFHLFPCDGPKVGMPSYSFLCQISSISSMAQKGFDFNACVYDGISYLSRAQEASLKQQYGNTRMIGTYPALSYKNKSTADTIFMERIRYQIEDWRNACLAPSTASKGGSVYFIETTVLNNEMFGTRPCLRIDAANNHQFQLILEVLREFSENLVPLSCLDEDCTEKVKVVFTCSEEDKHHLLSELRHQAEQQKQQVWGIQDVVDTIINSGKTIVGHNCLTDLAIIYSNFIARLPPNVKEFLCSLHGVFPHLLDFSHLLKVAYAKEIPRTKKAKNLQAALLHLNRQFFLPVNLEVPLEFKCHGYIVLRLTYLFAKVCRLLKIKSSDGTIDGWTGALASYANILYPSGTCFSKSKYKGEVVELEEDSFYLKTSNIVFIWGFKIGSSSHTLMEMLCNMHETCQKGVEVHLVDESCACIRFKRSKHAESFLHDVQSGTNISGFAKSKPLEEISKAGLRAVRYDVYEKLCKSSIWRSKLADSFELAISESDGYVAGNFTMDLPSSKTSPFIIELEDLQVIVLWFIIIYFSLRKAFTLVLSAGSACSSLSNAHFERF